MGNKSYSQISDAGLSQYFEDLVNQSNRKWQSAIIIANNGDFSSAISLAIISAEELVKALIARFDMNGFKFRKINGMDVFLKNHQIRYFVTFSIFAIGIFEEDLVFLLKKLAQEKEPYKLIEKAKSKEAALNRSMNRYLEVKIRQVGSELNWFSNVDALRQDGFYIDYDPTTKRSVELTDQKYAEVFEKLGKVRSLGLLILDYVNPSAVDNHNVINQLRVDFDTKGFYKKIEELLKNLKATRETPFDIFRKFLFPSQKAVE